MIKFVVRILALLLPPIIPKGVRFLWDRLHRSKKPEQDSPVIIEYGDYYMRCDSSHHLPPILAKYPDFGRVLADIVSELNVRESVVIDVGANIGDTAILLARFAPGARVLCIEGDPSFMDDLKHNTAQISGVTLAPAILSDRSELVKGAMVRTPDALGTGRFVEGGSDEALRTWALDDLLSEYREFASPNVLKIDTDGFETRILHGAKGVLSASRPVVFYEWAPYFYEMAGADDVSHAEFLMDIGYSRFLFFTNTGEPMLRVQRPGRDVLSSLADFSRIRQGQGFHYDIAAFTEEKEDISERLWKKIRERYLETGLI
jgi:FkbM family methyltransferase